MKIDLNDKIKKYAYFCFNDYEQIKILLIYC
jgi:hypothetical protein